MNAAHLAACASALFLCACSQGQADGAPDEPAETTAAPAPEPTVTAADLAVPTLAGRWRVIAIDDQPYEAFMPLELYGNDYRIYWEPPCAAQERRYSIDGTRFSAWQEQSESPPIVCEIGLPERLPDVWRAFDNGRALEATDTGGARISGGGYSVTLSR